MPYRWCWTCREYCSQRFRYKAGQFLTLRVTVDGRDHRRCYSMSSAADRG